jgi:glyoxylase-like metal-dependent hydrolase (beta-lactamase superfamily II)
MMIPDLPSWCGLVRADNPGPMTLDGTNTYVLGTTAGNVVVDPGPLLEPHLRSVADLGPVVLTVLTHHHPDHAGGAPRFHELTGAPVVARDPRLCIDGEPLIDDGARLDVAGLDVRVVHTPGHTADSVSLTASDGVVTVLLSGDTVLGRGTSIVAHPDGNLEAYLGSLGRLREIVGPGWVLAPAHGPVRTDADVILDEYLTHRRLRLDQVRDALSGGASTPREIVEIVYADVDRAVWPAAEATVRAQLEYLQQPT